MCRSSGFLRCRVIDVAKNRALLLEFYRWRAGLGTADRRIRLQAAEVKERERGSAASWRRVLGGISACTFSSVFSAGAALPPGGVKLHSNEQFEKRRETHEAVCSGPNRRGSRSNLAERFSLVLRALLKRPRISGESMEERGAAGWEPQSG